MAINMSQVRALCNKSEKELFDSSSAKRIKELRPARLKSKIVRARKLRDKYRDLADRQQRQMRGKQDPRRPAKATSNEATRTKQQLFQELMERFEDALAKAESQVEKKPASTSGTTKKTTTKKSTTRKASTKKAGTKKAGTKKTTTKKAGSKKTAAKKTASKKASTKKASTQTMSAKKLLSKKGSAKKAATKKAAPKKVVARKSEQSKAMSETTISELSAPMRITRRYQDANTNKIQGHISSRDRRSQSKRDAKGGR